MSINDLLKEKREAILRIASEHGAYNVRLFGSVARGEAGSESDIDFLVRLEPGTTLLRHAALVRKLKDLLGRDVQIVSERALRRRIKDRVLQEAIPLMRDDPERLQDILGAIESIEKYASQGFDAYLRDELVQVWIVHHIQIIGEAAANLSPATRDLYPDIPWPDIVAMRNVLVHQYFGVDLQEIWDTVTTDLRIVKGQVQEILKKLRERES